MSQQDSTSSEIVARSGEVTLSPRMIYDGSGLAPFTLKMDEYVSYLKHCGWTDDQVRSLSIRLAPFGFIPGGGSYNPKLKQITLTTLLVHNPSKLLIHETQHASDDLFGKINPAERVYAATTNFGFLLAILMAMYELVGMGGVPQYFAYLPIALLTLSFVLYLYNPVERRARRAASSYSADLITRN